MAQLIPKNTTPCKFCKDEFTFGLKDQTKVYSQRAQAWMHTSCFKEEYGWVKSQMHELDCIERELTNLIKWEDWEEDQLSRQRYEDFHKPEWHTFSKLKEAVDDVSDMEG
jgi:hypothetical protein